MKDVTKAVIVGGHGKVAMRLARLLSVKPDHQVVSIFRNPEHEQEVAQTGATPLLLSLEDNSKDKFAEAFAGADVVYFSAGAGEKGYPDRTRKVDHEGAVKVFDAIEQLEGAKPRFIMVSAVDIRDRSKVPAHYNEQDLAISTGAFARLGVYMQAKYEADKNLSQRTAFKWAILRPGPLVDSPGTGKARIGKAIIRNFGPAISRDDVASILVLLAKKLAEDPKAAGLGIDLMGGEDKIEDALDAFIEKGVSDFAP